MYSILLYKATRGITIVAQSLMNYSEQMNGAYAAIKAASNNDLAPSGIAVLLVLDRDVHSFEKNPPTCNDKRIVIQCGSY